MAVQSCLTDGCFTSMSVTVKICMTGDKIMQILLWRDAENKDQQQRKRKCSLYD